jgi:hypothetical protein
MQAAPFIGREEGSPVETQAFKRLQMKEVCTKDKKWFMQALEGRNHPAWAGFRF